MTFPETLAGYLGQYGSTLIETIERASSPLHRAGDRDHYCRVLREPMPEQWDRIEAVVKSWKAGRRAVVFSGETGVGKTLMSSVAVYAHAAKHFRAIVVCPPHLTKKWVRELELTIPDVKAKIINHYSDLVAMKKFGAPKCPEYYIMSDSKSKLGPAWKPAYTKRVKQGDGLLRCPCCDTVIMKRVTVDDDAVEIPSNHEDLQKKQVKCKECESPLYQWTGSIDRWPCADFIHKHMRGYFDYLIIDEAHFSSGQNTAIGNASAKLKASIRYRIEMTGTLINGYASSLFPMIYRSDSSTMVNLGFEWTDTMKFVGRYGRIETVTKHKTDERSNRSSKGKIVSKSVRMRPGIVPTIFADCLMDKGVFCSLEDLNYNLPVQHEIIHGVDMDEELEFEYRKLESDLRDGLRAMLAAGGKAAMATLLNTLLGWPDHPFGFGPVGYSTDEGWRLVAEPVDLDPDVVRNKERALVDIVKDVVRRDRQAWVFSQMTVTRDVQARLQKLLLAEGLDCRVLRANTVATDKREEWIAKNGKAEVILSHPALVQTGLDLFAVDGRYNFCSLIFFQTGYVLNTVRQAGGRARRVGQTKECELMYMYYRSTMQEKAAFLMSEKIRAAQAIDGKFTATGLSSLSGGDEDVSMALVSALVGKR